MHDTSYFVIVNTQKGYKPVALQFYVRKTRQRFSVLFAVFIAVVGAVLVMSIWHTASAISPSVRPLSPANNSQVSGQVKLSSRVDGLGSQEYEMFWAVGNGQWNRMTTNLESGISTDTIDTSKWSWAQNNTYVIRFIALVKSSGQPIESSVTITKSSSTSIETRRAALPEIVNKPLFTDPETIAGEKSKQSTNLALNYIASQPTARWFGGWNEDVAADVSEYVSRAEAANAVPVLVLYNIPKRDCGSYSAGGVSSYQAYSKWVQQVAAGIGNRAAIIIIEPDALADASCLNKQEKSQRSKAIAESVVVLSNSQTKTYIDAGNPKWHTASEMAKRLKEAGVANATGFSLNVSNFQTTKSNESYGTKIAKLIGNKHFVIDTSRNGKGPAANSAWCNPLGRGLGQEPTLSTGTPLADAYLWIKAPGESDGACGRGAPIAGEWWQGYAEGLYRNRANR